MAPRRCEQSFGERGAEILGEDVGGLECRTGESNGVFRTNDSAIFEGGRTLHRNLLDLAVLLPRTRGRHARRGEQALEGLPCAVERSGLAQEPIERMHAE